MKQSMLFFICLFIAMQNSSASTASNAYVCQQIVVPIIQKLLANNSQVRIYKKGDTISESSVLGMSIGVVLNGQTCMYNAGQVAWGTGVVPNENTVYEIGSITKTFTATIFGLLAQNNQIQLNRLVGPDLLSLKPSMVLPSNYNVINYGELAAFFAGFPDMPPYYYSNKFPKSIAGFSQDQMAEFINLRLIRFSNLIGTYRYSNVGYGLLGELLMIIDGYSPNIFLDKMTFINSFSDWIKKYISSPLHMYCTDVNLLKNKCQQIASGYINTGTKFEPTLAWPWSSMAAASNLSSTTNDMTKYIQAYLNNRTVYSNDQKNNFIVSKKLLSAMQFSLKNPAPLKPIPGQPGNYQALAWAQVLNGSSWYVKNGATQGFMSQLMIEPSLNAGVIVLTNTYNEKYNTYPPDYYTAANILNKLPQTYTTNINFIGQKGQILQITDIDNPDKIYWSIPTGKTQKIALPSTIQPILALVVEGQSCNIGVNNKGWQTSNCSSPAITISLPKTINNGTFTVGYSPAIN